MVLTSPSADFILFYSYILVSTFLFPQLNTRLAHYYNLPKYRFKLSADGRTSWANERIHSQHSASPAQTRMRPSVQRPRGYSPPWKHNPRTCLWKTQAHSQNHLHPPQHHQHSSLYPFKASSRWHINVFVLRSRKKILRDEPSESNRRSKKEKSLTAKTKYIYDGARVVYIPPLLK